MAETLGCGSGGTSEGVAGTNGVKMEGVVSSNSFQRQKLPEGILRYTNWNFGYYIGYKQGSSKCEIQEAVSPEFHEVEELDVAKLEEQASHLEKDLIVKERETLDVLKELEKTKLIMDELKQKLQKEASEVNSVQQANAGETNVTPVLKEEEKENNVIEGGNLNSVEGVCPYPSAAPGLILMELKQAKLNLSRTTTDLADIRSSVDSFNKKLEKERFALDKTRERLTQNSSKISSLEEELNQTKLKLQLAKDAESKGGSENPLDISKELHRLNSEVEQFKKVGEDARSEVLRATQEIEHTRTRIRTAEVRLVAARKMKEAARAAYV
ncbi:hypothetical protein L484_004646 [Morus notabilis]|uniref:WEB family protein n=1 Tax=Morus notabilis TaxID=981085 RepID=W9RQE4_9ROSA|nr:hypothetical protein L484_004646 [Morus notabilis]